MGYRSFVGRDGQQWEVRVRSRAEWELLPGRDNPGPQRVVPAPGYERDPFELSVEELQRLLDQSLSEAPRRKPSPFRDD